MGEKWCFSEVLICISLIMYKAKYFSQVSETFLCSLVNYLCLPLSIFVFCLFKRCISCLSVIHVANIFSQFHVCFLISLLIFFAMQIFKKLQSNYQFLFDLIQVLIHNQFIHSWITEFTYIFFQYYRQYGLTFCAQVSKFIWSLLFCMM